MLKCFYKIFYRPTLELVPGKQLQILSCQSLSRSEIKMIRFFTQMHPRLPSRGSSKMHHPECLTVVNESFVTCGAPIRNYAKKADKYNPDKATKAREEKESVPMPGFVNPEPMRSEGLLTQRVKQQIEEHKKKKEKPTLHNPEGRE